MDRMRSHPFFKRIEPLVERLRESDTLARIKYHLPPLNFITIHYAYFIITCLITSIIFWGMSSPAQNITYTDALFLVVSAMTEAGLNTVNLSEMTTGQQVILFILILIGSAIFVSTGTVLARKRAFETRFEHLVERQKEARRLKRKRSASVNREYREAQDARVEAKEQKDSAKAQEKASQYGLETGHGLSPEPLSLNTSSITEEKTSSAPETLPDEKSSNEKGERSPSATLNGNGNGNGIANSNSNGGSPPPNSNDDYFYPRPRNLTGSDDHISFSGMHYAHSPSSTRRPRPRSRSRVLTFVGVGAHPNSTSFRPPYTTSLAYRGPGLTPREAAPASGSTAPLETLHYPTYLTHRTTGRNGQFFGLSRDEREHLGGVEYRAITLLAFVVPLYFVLWQLLGCLALALYMGINKPEVARSNGINPWWLGVFNGVSAFNNSGMSLLDMNLIPFQKSIFPLLTMGLLILAGNTAYPLFLRFVLWSMLKLVTLVFPAPRSQSTLKATLRFILTYPRRVYTNLFPSAPTWWLFFTVLALNGVDWVFFELLNIGNPAIEAIPPRYRVLDGLFQALAVRSGGFYVVAIPSLRIGLQFLYVIMMYISAYPVVITMRHSNVYEERSLGIYTDDPDHPAAASHHPVSNPDDLPKLGHLFGKFKRSLTNNLSTSKTTTPAKRTTGTHFARQQIRGQLAHDLWWLAFAIFFITCVEVSNFERDPITYSVFNIIFEVVSAYGCVGISPGLPNDTYSFSGGWKIVSKLVLCAVMLRGRHRGLPVALDRAVRLPGSGGGRGKVRTQGELEEEDAVLRRSWSVRQGSISGGAYLGGRE